MTLGGEQSVFLDASLQSDIPGAMMGTVTMKKASQGKIDVNPDGSTVAPDTGRGLFTNETDWISAAIEVQNAVGATKDPDPPSDEERIYQCMLYFKINWGISKLY